jgi:predicted ABC-class ATPase
MFVRDLPSGVSTKNFNTLSASGSTSEAANLLEAMEAGSQTFLIDEDSSAVNFLIRDIRVRKLLGDDREPLIPLTDRIKELAAAGFSFILVAGACGDYLDLADNIIVMANYKAECAKFSPAPSTSSWRGEAPTGSTEPAEVTQVKAAELAKVPQPRAFATYMQPLQKSVRPTSAV